MIQENILIICTTYNRNTCLERALRFFIEQDYTEKATLLVFNSGSPTSISDIELPDNKKIVLVNRTLSIGGGIGYQSVGQKHQDAFNIGTELSEFTMVTHSDVDDIFFPNHISEGVKGLLKAKSLGKVIYKPKRSYCKYMGDIVLNENVYEPSMFISVGHIKQYGYLKNNVKYHDGWLQPAISQNLVFSDPEGIPTFCYDWGGDISVHKMSGREDNELNFTMSQNRERDFGTGVTSPLEREIAYSIFNDIKNSIPQS